MSPTALPSDFGLGLRELPDHRAPSRRDHVRAADLRGPLSSSGCPPTTSGGWMRTFPDLGWGRGVVQFGATTPKPPPDCTPTATLACQPNTWHWDNVSRRPPPSPSPSCGATGAWSTPAPPPAGALFPFPPPPPPRRPPALRRHRPGTWRSASTGAQRPGRPPRCTPIERNSDGALQAVLDAGPGRARRASISVAATGGAATGWCVTR